MRARLQPDGRRHHLAEKVIRQPVDVRIGDGRMFAQAVLDFLRRDVLAAADDQVLDAPRDADVAVGVDAGLVAAVQPAVRIDRLRRRLGVVVVALHHVVAAAAQLAALAGGALRAGRGIDDLHLELGQDDANRLAAEIEPGGRAASA